MPLSWNTSSGYKAVQKIGNVNAVIIYCTFKSPPSPEYTSYIDSLPYWYLQMGDYIKSYIQTASNGKQNINCTVLTNGSKPFIGNYDFDNTAPYVVRQNFTLSVLDSVNKKYDLSQFDNDGPDGIPNSGDDDGYVDYVYFVILWPLDRGGIGLNINSDWGGGDYTTSWHSNKPGFGNIKISGGGNAATQQIIYNQLSPIILHEYGHSVGNFPDIDHDYNGYFNHYSVGSFDVMAHVWGFNSVPSVYNPYFRDEYLNWLTPTIISVDSTKLLTDLLNSGTVYKYVPQNISNSYPGEEFYISYHTGLNRWELYWPKDPTYGGVLIWRANQQGYETNNDITNSIVYPQIISIEAAHGKWDWVEYQDSVHNTGVQDPLTGFDSLEIRKIANGKEIEGPYFNKDVGSRSVFFTPNSGQDFTFYTNPNSNLIYNDANTQKYAHNITDGFAVKNIRWLNGFAYADFFVDNYTVTTNSTLTQGNWYIYRNITIASGVTLTIQPGANLYFSSGDTVFANGILIANGNSTNPITFNRSGSTGNWGTITFNGSGASSSNLNYVNINYGAGIQCLNGANVTIQNSSMNNCVQGIYYYNSAPLILNNQIIDPQQNGIYGDASGNQTTIKNNKIKKNSTNPLYQNYQGIYIVNNSTPYIAHNDINGFYWGIYVGGGSIARFYYPDNWTQNNRIINNLFGLASGWGSYVYAGYQGVGGYNSFHNNSVYDVKSYDNSYLYAEYNYWGGGQAKGYYDGSSTLDVINYLTTDPWANIPTIQQKNNSPTLVYTTSAISSDANQSIADSNSSDIYNGLVLEDKGRIDDAINFYKTMISADKNADFAFTELCMLKNKYSRNDLLTYLDNIPASNKHYALVSKLIADNDLQNNRFDDAIGIFDKLISNYPNDYQGINAKFEELFAYLNIKNNKTKATQMLSEIKAMNLTGPEWEMRTKEAEVLLGLAGNHATKNQAVASSQNNEINNSPREYALFANYPNPFNPSTIISYQIPNNGFVSLKVYDMLGREVKILVNEFKTRGKYSISFDASQLASGVYFYQLRSGNYSSIKKMVLLK